jgi:hypothetical protein
MMLAADRSAERLSDLGVDAGRPDLPDGSGSRLAYAAVTDRPDNVVTGLVIRDGR